MKMGKILSIALCLLIGVSLAGCEKKYNEEELVGIATKIEDELVYNKLDCNAQRVNISISCYKEEGNKMYIELYNSDLVTDTNSVEYDYLRPIIDCSLAKLKDYNMHMDDVYVNTRFSDDDLEGHIYQATNIKNDNSYEFRKKH